MIWVLLAYLPFLWRATLPFTGDQKTYVAIALEMFQQGEWMRPLLFGAGNYLKPPFQYWATLVSWNVFGLSIFSTLLPSVLALIGTAFFLSEISSRLGERKWVVASGLWFAGSVGALTYGLAAQMEIYICFFWALAWSQALKFLEQPWQKRNWSSLYIAFFWVGVCAWVKSPLYSVLWVSSFFMYLLIAGEWLLFFQKRVYSSLLLGTVVGLSWYLLIFSIDGPIFWNQFVLQEQLDKDTFGSLSRLFMPLLYLGLPFSVLYGVALYSLRFRQKSATVYKFVSAWSLPAILFFSCFRYKTSAYLFILLPALSIFVDWGCFRASRTRIFRWSFRSMAILLAIASIGLGLIAFQINSIPMWYAVIGILLGFIILGVSWQPWIKPFLIIQLIWILWFRGLVSFPMEHERIEAVNALNRARLNAAQQLGYFDPSRDIWCEIGLVSAAVGEPMTRIISFDGLQEFLKNNGIVQINPEDKELVQSTLMEWAASHGFKLYTEEFVRLRRLKGAPLRELMAGNPAFTQKTFSWFYLRPLTP